MSMMACRSLFLALADLTWAEAVVVMACLCVACAVAVVVVVRLMAANDARLRWPVVGSPCEDPEC